jgi:hypothetical protein
MVPWIQQYLGVEELSDQRSRIDPSVRADLLGELHFHYAARRNPLAREKIELRQIVATLAVDPVTARPVADFFHPCGGRTPG